MLPGRLVAAALCIVRGRAKTNDLNEKIARLPNGACWNVLSYWREAE